MQPLVVSIEIEGEPIVGSSYMLECAVSTHEGLLGVPEVAWVNSSNGEVVWEGVDVTKHADGTVRSRLSINPLQLSHGGEYRCNAHLMTSVVKSFLNETATTIVTVKCKFNFL